MADEMRDEVSLVGIDPAHSAVAKRMANGEWEVNCGCGARWTHNAAITEHGMLSIYESHLEYVHHRKMETL